MKILAIDTSGQQAGAAILDGYITIGEIILNARTGEKSWTHSEILMPGIDQLFALTGTARHDIDYIAYTNGPGSFTGLRIGASTALGLAAGLNRPTVAVPTLDALAYNVKGTGVCRLVVPLMDARRGQVYAAVYEDDVANGMKRITDYLAVSAKDLAEMSIINDTPVIFLGDGACANREFLQSTIPHAAFTPQNNNRQRASSAAVWAMEQILAGYTPPDNPEILYVRAPQAILDLERKRQCSQ